MTLAIGGGSFNSTALSMNSCLETVKLEKTKTILQKQFITRLNFIEPDERQAKKEKNVFHRVSQVAPYEDDAIVSAKKLAIIHPTNEARGEDESALAQQLQQAEVIERVAGNRASTLFKQPRLCDTDMNKTTTTTISTSTSTTTTTTATTTTMKTRGETIVSSHHEQDHPSCRSSGSRSDIHKLRRNSTNQLAAKLNERGLVIIFFMVVVSLFDASKRHQSAATATVTTTTTIALLGSYIVISILIGSQISPVEGALTIPKTGQSSATPAAATTSQRPISRSFHSIISSNSAQPEEATRRGSPVEQVSVFRSKDGELNSFKDQEARAGHWSLPNRPSLFSIIRFPNEECFDSSNQSGTCYTAFECKLLGGQPSSPCAAGFGSCCIVSRTCHVTTREKVVYFKNPSYPSADSDEKFCDLTVEMSDINVCQLRLDFLDFQLDPPTNGACKDDYMEISASGMPPQTVPRLCGLNRNQHLYITVPQDFSERSASIVFYTDPVGDHRWQVKVTQIDCNHYKPIDWKRSYGKYATSPLWNAHPNGMKLPIHLMGKYSTTFASGFQTMSQTASALAYEFLKPQFTPRAPMGCLQYFTQPSSIIESFNFGQYLNNMDYSICIQRQPDTCRVVFTSSDYDWSLNGVGVSGSSSGVGDQDCARDYLLIPGASRTGDGFTYDRYCGGRLNYYRGQTLSAPVVIKTAGPIVLRFHSDGHYEGLNNGGFRLQYDQSAQDCIYHTAEESGSLASQQILASTLSDSRPLNQQLGSIVAEPPVLYSSQQLSLMPMHQLTSSDNEHPLYNSSMNGNNKQLTNEATTSIQINGRPNKQQVDQQEQFQQETTEHTYSNSGNSIKRLDYGSEESSYIANGDRSRFVSPHKPLVVNTNLNKKPFGEFGERNKLLAFNLSKAFELITARSSNWSS